MWKELLMSKEVIRVFLDDFRRPENCVIYMNARIGNKARIYNEHWFMATNYHEFVALVSGITSSGEEIDVISLDHDLSDEHYDIDAMVNPDEYGALYETFVERTGLDCARWLKAHYEALDKPLPEILVHSMNPVGRQNIINEFKTK
jgi:hypothetical protein